MILADTSIWVDHLRAKNAALMALLDDDDLLMHPFVIGEIALGYLNPRDDILVQFEDFHFTTLATDADVLKFIDRERLFGTGIGYVDAHLLASVRLTPGSLLWTRDKRLHDVSSRLNVAANIK